MEFNASQTADRIEALLFNEGGPLTKKKLSQVLNITPEQLSEALVALSARRNGGIALIESELEVALGIAPDVAQTVDEALQKELGKEIGDAGLEVLAIVLYRGPSTRAQIDYIRGVNTSSTVRNLAARGLIERAINPEDSREYLYRPTVELLAYLGVSEAAALPEYARIASELASFEQEQKSPFENHGNEPGNEAGE